MTGVGLWEVSENGRPAMDRIGGFSLKVIVYGMKSVNNIEKISPLLVISFNIYLLIVLRVPRAYATSAFSGLKVNVYGMKGVGLRDERCRFMG